MIFRTLITLSALLIGGTVQADTKLVGGDMHFHGTIRALACSIAPTKSRSISGKSRPRIFILLGAVSRKNSVFSSVIAILMSFVGSP